MSCVDLSPGFDNRDNLVRAHVCQSDIVSGAECKYVAFALDGFRLQQKSRQTAFSIGRGVVILRLFDGAVVVDEDEGILELGIGVARGSLIAWTQIAFGIVLRELNETW